ncbi:MAG: hypothetical protein QXI32_04095 [Candidatus Bathyarchaeia archaeon]
MTTTSNPFIIPTFIFAGVALKTADWAGESADSAVGYLSATIAGMLLGMLTSYGSDESSIVTGLILGVALAGKIDRPNLVFGVVVTAVTALVAGFQTPRIWLLILVSTLSVVDEAGHDRAATKSRPIGTFFRFRGSLKLAVLATGITSMVPLATVVGFLGFDIGYDAVDWVLEHRIK